MNDPAFLLDTDICIYIVGAVSERLRTRLGEQDEGALAVSAITLAELEIGLRDRPDQRNRLEIFLAEVPVLPFDRSAAQTYGAIPHRRGRHDRLIAAHALSLGLTLVTNNERDFADVPGLRVENWTLPL